jgi:hypothetical protein
LAHQVRRTAAAYAGQAQGCYSFRPPDKGEAWRDRRKSRIVAPTKKAVGVDRAVAAAYGWPEDIATDNALARLLALNLERARVQKS